MTYLFMCRALSAMNTSKYLSFANIYPSGITSTLPTDI